MCGLYLQYNVVLLLAICLSLRMMAECDNFQQTKRQAMATSYTRLLWALAHIHGAIF